MSLLIAFSSYRRRGDAADIYFYRHDGKSAGEPVEAMPTESPRDRVDYRPYLSADGRYCAFSWQYRESDPGGVGMWDRQEKKLVPLPDKNPTGADAQAAISSDARWMVFAGWQRPGGKGGHDLFLYDLKENKQVPLPNLNSEYDEQMPAISGEGRWIAFVTNRPLQDGGFSSPSRILLYDRSISALVPTPGLTPGNCRDTEPSFSGDGRYLAFASDRPGPDDPHGAGDICVYDLHEKKLVPLPGLNSGAHDCQPAISQKGRFIAFTSERLDAPGQRDIFLYDRRESKLLPTPHINTPGEEFEPSITVLDPSLEA